MKNKSLFHVFTNGLLNENPTFRLLLGMCPTLAISTAASSGVGMGLATTFVLVFSNMVISMLRHIIPERVRIPGFIVVIATFVTIIDLIIKAFLPSMSDTLGIYIPLIVVNCIILARAESFASKNGPLASAADGLFMGIGFTLALTLMGAFREILGAGSVFGVKLWDFKIEFFASSAGAFFTFGLFIAVFGFISYTLHTKHKIKAYRLKTAETAQTQTAEEV